MDKHEHVEPESDELVTDDVLVSLRIAVLVTVDELVADEDLVTVGGCSALVATG